MTTDTIKFKRGMKNKLNELAYGEPAYISDEGELYIGTESGVEKLTSNKEVKELSSQLDTIETNKLNKDDKIKSSQLAIDSNANKIKLINLSDEVQQALTGNAPALSVIPNKSITLEKIGFVTTGKNLFNKATATFGKMLDYKSTTLKDTTDYYVSDYIEVDSSTQYTLNKTYGFAYYDSSKTGISGHLPADFGGSTGGILTITTPSNAKYIRFNIYKTLIDVTQFEKGSSATNYENYYAYINRQYVERQPFLVDEIPNGSVGIDKLNFIKFTKNMFDKSKVSDVGWYMAYNNGIPTSNEYVKTVCYSDFIQVEKGEKYIVNQLHSYCYFDSSKKYISGEYTKNEPYVLEIPVDCKYVVLNLQHPNIDKIQFEKGEECTEYESYGYNLIGMVDKIEEKKEFLNLPEKYELVVGDTFELFYKGIILANNPYNYNIKITCSKGSAYSKRYIFIPSSSDIGIHTMTINIINDNEEVLDTKTVNLVVKAKASNPSSVKNVLCVGDSLTVNGVWVSECCRRLTGSSGNPVGEGLSNINFVGTCIGTDNAKFEGYGGWRYEHYNSNKVENQQYWITTTTNKNNTYQKSKWKDSNNIVWIIEEIESNRIKLYRNTNGVQMLPSSGALTWVSGGDGSDNTSIVYTSYTTEAGNPFWNNDTNKVDFLNYATKLGVSSIDYCYVLLGWNSTNDSESVTKDNIRKFINNIRTSYPNCKITLLGLQVPSIDGFGSNYGCSWNYFDKLKFVFNYNKWNLEVSKEFTEVDFINISSQFDSENNIQLGERQINARNSKTEIYGTNGVHPAKEGYLQIADAVYRNLTHKL